MSPLPPFRYFLFAAAIAATLMTVGARRAPALPRSRITENVSTGRIEGTITLSSTITQRRPRFRIYAEPGIASRPAAARPRDEMRNVVIYVQVAPVTESLAPSRATMGQKDQFIPHLLPVYRGATVDFMNDDDVFHNVFSLSSAGTFDLGRFPKGSFKSYTFDQPGTVQVFCHIHADMSAIVLVLANPYFAIPSDAGRYVIEGVPRGEYTVVGWHQRVKPIAHVVHVGAGETTRLDFNIPVPPVSDAGPASP